MKLLPKTLTAAVGALAFGLSLSAQAGPVIADLTAGAGATGTINDAVYTWVPEIKKPFGSGFIDPFVRIGGEPDVVHGYNSTNETYNTDSTDTFNHEIQVGQVGFIEVSPGVKVMRFLLDINQNSGGDGSFLSLDEVQIYISTIPNQSTAPGDLITTNGTLSLGTLVYRMDGGEGDFDNHALLDYDKNKGGSGFGDMYLDIPMEMFLAAFTAGGNDFDTVGEQNSAYIYLYSRFGQTAVNNDGYEEWTYVQGNAIVPPCTDGQCVCPPPTVGTYPDCRIPPNEAPEPGTLAILGSGLLALSYMRRRRNR